MNVNQMMDETFKGVELAQDNARIAHEAIRQRDELRAILQSAQELRPKLLAQYGAVPECVLDFCNRARAAIAPRG